MRLSKFFILGVFYQNGQSSLQVAFAFPIALVRIIRPALFIEVLSDPTVVIVATAWVAVWITVTACRNARDRGACSVRKPNLKVSIGTIRRLDATNDACTV